MRVVKNTPQRTKVRKPSYSAGILMSMAMVLLITSCGPRNNTPIPISQPTRVPSSAPVVSPTSTPTLPSSTAEPNPTNADTPGSAASTSSSSQAPTSFTFLPDADAFVKKSQPDANFGNVTDLNVDSGSDSIESYIHFTITDISGTVQDAKLRLYAKTNGSLDGPAVYNTGGDWSEDTITWNNRPIRNSAVDNSDQIDPETWAEYDVTKSVVGQGAISFVLAADSGDAIVFDSREDSHPPELVVSYVPDNPTPTPTLSAQDVTFAGAGEIASCTNDNDELTAQLLDNIPGVVFTTGDNVVDGNAYSEFINCYDPTWGRHKSRTNPVPGEIDYQASDPSGYFKYFNGISPYYAYDLGNWRIYGLNSNFAVEENSKQAAWLKLDLSLNPRKCVLAFWHRPRWSSGATYGNTQRLQDLWKILYDAGAELVLNGYEQNYERFMPMDANGLADPHGMREFVIGTGGGGLTPFGDPLPTSQVRNDTAYGVLKLTLRSDSYDWQFVPVAGSTFTDSGSTQCH